MKTCTVDECGKKHRARGLCTTHYNQQHQPNRHAKVDVPCAACGRVVKKDRNASRRQVCSHRCRYFVTHGRWPEAGRELIGPVVVVKDTRPDTVVLPSTQRGFVSIQCAWCGVMFVHDLRVTGNIPRFCQDRCRRGHHKAERRITQGRFQIAPARRLAIYERDDWTCQLCAQPVDQSLPPHHKWAATLDHIECQAWSLIPDHSESNLRLAHRMCNSTRGDERFISPAA